MLYITHSYLIHLRMLFWVIKQKRTKLKRRVSKELIDYQSKYHCLANFWVIPMCHGRTSAKLNPYDSLDAYLNKICTGAIKNEDEYYQNFTYESFLEIHGMSWHKISEKPLEIYIKKDKRDCMHEIQRIYDF